jgi:hypothetical protein
LVDAVLKIHRALCKSLTSHNIRVGFEIAAQCQTANGFDFERLFNQVRGSRLSDTEISPLIDLVKTVYGPRMREQGRLTEADLKETGLPIVNDGRRKPKDLRQLNNQRFLKLNSEWASQAYHEEFARNRNRGGGALAQDNEDDDENDGDDNIAGAQNDNQEAIGGEEVAPLVTPVRKRKRRPTVQEAGTSEKRIRGWESDTIHKIQVQLNRVRKHATLSEEVKTSRTSALNSLIQGIETGAVTETNYTPIIF